MSNRFIGARQTTLAREIQLTGTGVHSGAPVSLTLHPAEADTGLRFLVTKRGKVISEIAAHVANVKNLTLCTVIGDGAGTTVGTVEHLLAALRGLSIDNLYIEIDSKEVPIMDGSSAVFVDAIDRVGIRELSEPRKYIKVLKPVRAEENGCWGTLEPHAGFRMDVEIDFSSPIIGNQRLQYEMSPGIFRHEISRARTFGFMSDVEKLWKAGLALGADLTNTVAIGEDKIMNKEGLRYPQEFVRHKMLDAVGDLALAGMPLLGAYRSYRGGHRLNSMVLQALFADASNWEIAQAPRARATRSPVHLVPQTVVAAE
ncbi:UDP-3-O-acyl-N-acetylglucosamine deacetylase [Hyphomicrobium sp.]|uniref:UDP-3-O-acyl-N-acetylglucosamine deacetylase n=1 Tax=Hyphomicrobium sp. TaxID=82 RepID=UPI001D2520A2|nr:UDP-3-O-acyl-N-acetylglucosamine deacetylase [Hyphomicrobium sp.]MBY0559695.1 UDP-3-O-acyl-N-acetylglucosamine deacetylase [Hyphomicrobium sp.]